MKRKPRDYTITLNLPLDQREVTGSIMRVFQTLPSSRQSEIVDVLIAAQAIEGEMSNASVEAGSVKTGAHAISRDDSNRRALD